MRITIPQAIGGEAEPVAERDNRDPLSGDERILVVEDQDPVRAAARRILAARGYTVLEAPTCNEALAMAVAHQGNLDLLVTDVVMPQMSGRELAERLKRWCPEIKALFISGYSAEAAEQAGRLPPGTAFLEKPFDHGALLAEVRELLDGAYDLQP